MTTQQAISLIKNGIQNPSGTWIDIGAGTGTFSLALEEILPPESTIIAADKNPHALYTFRTNRFLIVEADFTRPMELPIADGIIMANTLHYAPNPANVLKNVLRHLKSEGTFILVEYDMKKPLIPWVPYPIPFDRFSEIAVTVGLGKPKLIKEIPSAYGPRNIYSAVAHKG